MDPNAQPAQDQNTSEPQPIPVTIKPTVSPLAPAPASTPAPAPALTPALAPAPASTPVAEAPALVSVPPAAVTPATVLTPTQETVTAPIPETGAPTGPIIGSTTPITGGSNEPPVSGAKSKKKLFIVAGAGLAALTAIFVGAYLFLYLPTTPSRLYSTGLERTGKAFSTFIEKATAKDQLEAIGSTEIIGDYTATMDGQSATGKLSSTFNSTSSDSSIDFKTPDFSVNAQIMTNLAESATFPDIFFKIKGLESTGILSFLPALAPYEDKWVSVSASYLATVIDQSDSREGYSGIDFNAEDAAELVKITTQKTNEYVFTADPKKAIFDEEKYIDSPIIDGSKTHHYSVQLNEAHLEAYCLDLSNSILSSKAYKNLASNPSASELTEQKASTEKDCKDKKDEKPSLKYEMWISTKTKLLHKMRIAPADKSGDYYEIGQNYTGGETLPIFFRHHNEANKFDVNVTMLSNLDKSTTTLKLDVKESKGGSTGKNQTITANLTFKPYKGKINTTPPAGAIPFEQLMSALNGTSNSSSKVSTTNTTNGRIITQSSTRTTQTTAPIELYDFFKSLQF